MRVSTFMAVNAHFQGIVLHFGKYAYTLICFFVELVVEIIRLQTVIVAYHEDWKQGERDSLVLFKV